jgi:hypothetical protein
MGSLRRIAALCFLATFAVMAAGGLSVHALDLPGTSVTVPTTTTTVPVPTVRVPSTPTVVTPPPAPKPVVKAPAPAPVKQVTQPVTNVVKKAVPQTTNTVKNAVPQTTSTVKKAVPQTSPVTQQGTDTVRTGTKTITQTLAGSGSGGGSGGGSAGSTGSLVGGVTGVLGGTQGTAGSTSGLLSQAGGNSNLAPGMATYFGGPGGPGGTFGGGSAGGFGGDAGAAGNGSPPLAMMLAGASPKQLRSVLEHLEGCLPALPAVDRRVISMRAGLNGAPLTRPQIGARLGLSRQTVRQTERRALNRLQYAAANTSCAAAVVGPFDVAGIGSLLPQLVFAGAVPVNTFAGGDPAGDFAQARGIVSPSASPLFDLGGGGESGPAWAIILFTVLFSVSIAALTRELRSSF